MVTDDKTEDNIHKGKLLVSFVLEMVGKPKEHVEETLKDFVEKLKEDESLDFVKSEIAEAKPLGKGFSAYAELEIWIKGMEKVFAFCLDAMPTSVEIIEPPEFRLKSTDLSNMLNDLQAKLHEVDLLVKQLRIKNKLIEENGNKLLQNFITWTIQKTNKTADQIAKDVGMKEEHLKPFLEAMVSAKLLEMVDGRWYKKRT